MTKHTSLNTPGLTMLAALGIAGLMMAAATAVADRPLPPSPDQARAANDADGRLDPAPRQVPEPIDLDHHHLFNRAPREALRPLAPEPHPYTTEPGWFQIEIDPLNFTYNRDGDERTYAFEVPVLFKAGVLENVDFHIGVDAFVWEKVRDRDTRQRERDHGFGDLTLASKINLWGNDGGDSAASVYPFLVLPTARHDLGPDGVEGGVMLPTFWDLGYVELEFTPWAAAIRGGGANRYEGEFGQLTVLSRGITDELVGFVEFESVFFTEAGEDWVGIVATGLTWERWEDTVIEAGIGFGVTSAADTLNAFITVVQRF